MSNVDLIATLIERAAESGAIDADAAEYMRRDMSDDFADYLVATFAPGSELQEAVINWANERELYEASTER